MCSLVSSKKDQKGCKEAKEKNMLFGTSIDQKKNKEIPPIYWEVAGPTQAYVGDSWPNDNSLTPHFAWFALVEPR